MRICILIAKLSVFLAAMMCMGSCAQSQKTASPVSSQQKQFAALAEFVEQLFFSTDGKYLIALEINIQGKYSVTVRDSQSLSVTEQKTFSQNHKIEANKPTAVLTPELRIFAESFVKDGWKYNVRFYDFKTKTIVGIDEQPHGIYYMTSSPKGRYVLCSTPSSYENNWQVFDVSKAPPVSILKGNSSKSYASFALFDSKDASLAIGLSDGTIQLWDMTTLRPIQTLKNRTFTNPQKIEDGEYSLLGMAFLKNGLLACLHQNGKLDIWNLQKKIVEYTRFLPNATRMSASSKGHRIAIGGKEGDGQICNEKGTVLETFTKDKNQVTALCFDSSGKTLAVGYKGGNVKVISVKNS